MNELFWGIDLGGTKVEGVVFHGDNIAKPLCRYRVPTGGHRGYRHILGQIAHVVEEMGRQTGEKPRHLGIGGPGAVMPGSGKMMNANTTCLNGKPMEDDLKEILGIPIRVANDANCFALAEALYGAGKGSRMVFGSITGTGVGGGLVFDGKVWPGKMGIAGEWGHNILEPDGEPCYCGKQGCLETIFSGPALEKYYAKLAGTPLPLKEIVANSETDPHAAATLERLFTMYGKAIAQIINILDPDVVVLGGGVGHVKGFAARATEAAKPWVFHPHPKVKLVKPLLGDSAGVFGAALLWNGE